MNFKFYQNSYPFISNDFFIYLSDIILIEKYDEDTTNNIFVKGLNTNDKNIIIFLKTELLLYYLPFLMSLNKTYILITTCNDDFCVPHFEFPQNNIKIIENVTKLLNNARLLKWFTKNPSINHSKLVALPLGPKWQYYSTDFFGEDKQSILKTLNYHCIQPEKNFKNTGLKSRLLYFNFSIGTTDSPLIKEHKNMRREVENIFRKKNFYYNENKNFEDYIKELSSYKFCLSPPGRGVDTHRTWEALMVGTIPIMISTNLDALFEELPVIIVKDWNIIDVDFLNAEYKRLHKKQYNFSILYSEYWKNEINKYL